MLTSRSPWRAAAVLGAAGVIAGLIASQGSPAAASTPTAGSSVTVLSTTTTVPRTTTTTARPTTTTTHQPTTTTTAPKKSPSTGVPKVPVGGPPTTKPPKGAKPAPPPNPGPILSAVQTDLSQLTAIQDYASARAQVAANQQHVTLAAAGLQSTLAAQKAARVADQAAATRVGQAETRLRSMAIAAYIGLGYNTPAGGSQGLGASGNGTVSTLGGLSGTALTDAKEMLHVVAVHVRADVTETRQQLGQAAKAASQAGKDVVGAEDVLATAQAGLATSQQTLSLVTQAATNPATAAAFNLLTSPASSLTPSGAAGGQPASAGPGGATPTPAAASSPPAAGLSALSASQSPGSQASGSPSSGSSASASSASTASPATATPATATATAAAGTAGPATSSPTVLGAPMLNAAELAAWFASTGHKANTTVPIQQLAADYVKAGHVTGVRADIAFAQSVVETGFFSFPPHGQLIPKDNNFAGIGACDTCAHGWSFKDALTGVEAQLELLEAYASAKPVATPLVGPVGVGGCCPTWIDLAGTWASSVTYGISIMTIYHQMLNWLIPQRLVSAGLIGATKPATAEGPTLATLPGTTTPTTAPAKPPAKAPAHK